MKSLEIRAAEMLRALLEQVPAVTVERIEFQVSNAGREIDFQVHLKLGKRSHTLLCEVKSNGQPRYTRSAVHQLRNDLAHQGENATALLIAPYLSPEAQALCREQDVGFLDFEGNARMVFDGVFIERQVANKPVTERRELKSLFRQKSAQVLRVMFRDPERHWRVAELAEASGVSLGHISNVRVGLLEREWARVSDKGLSLSAPDALLDAWRDAYEPPAGTRLSYYTTLHGSAFEEAVRQEHGVDPAKGQVMLASFSAARWIAPYARTGTEYFYADEAGVAWLRSALRAAPALQGENLVVTQLRDDGLFRDAAELAPGVVGTSPIQTYLDLACTGERGREAAEHLRREKLRWVR